MRAFVFRTADDAVDYKTGGKDVVSCTAAAGGSRALATDGSVDVAPHPSQA